jgi:hypothetical protein
MVTWERVFNLKSELCGVGKTHGAGYGMNSDSLIHTKFETSNSGASPFVLHSKEGEAGCHELKLHSNGMFKDLDVPVTGVESTPMILSRVLKVEGVNHCKFIRNL